MRILYVLLLCLFSTGLVIGQRPARSVLQDILRYEASHDNATDLTFNKRNLEFRRKWLTPSLYRLYLAELAREEKEATEHPDEKPYFGDGMNFGPMKELCRSAGKTYRQKFRLISSRATRDSAYLRSRFYYGPRECEGDKPTEYTFIFKKTNGSWLLDDINYGTNGTLRKDLSRAR